MKCEGCGAELEKGAIICPQCGRAVERTEPTVDENFATNPMTKKEFYKLGAMKSCRVNINSCAALLYFSAAVTAVVSLIGMEGIASSLLDAIVLLVLGLLIQLTRSRVAAIVAAAYGLLGMVISIASTGQRSGYLIVLAGIWAVYYTFQFHSRWNKYKKDGTIPAEAEGKKKKK